VAVARFAHACFLGMALGIWYGFLRPFRQKHTAAGDTLFLIVTGWVCLILGFEICGGDLRIGYFFGLGMGAFFWEGTFGRLLAPFFGWFWRKICGIGRMILFPLKKIWKFAKFLFASAEKWVTIKCNNRRRFRRTSGGPSYGRKQKRASQRADQISPQQADYQDSGNCRYRVVYGGTADPALRSERY